MTWKMLRKPTVREYTKHPGLLQRWTWTVSERKISTERWNNIQARGTSGSTPLAHKRHTVMGFMSSENIQLGIKFLVFCACVSKTQCQCKSEVASSSSSSFCLSPPLFHMHVQRVCLWQRINPCMCSVCTYSRSCFTSLFTLHRWSSRVKCRTQTEIRLEWRRHAGIWQIYSCSLKPWPSTQQINEMEAIQSRTEMIQWNYFMSAAHRGALRSQEWKQCVCQYLMYMCNAAYI